MTTKEIKIFEKALVEAGVYARFIANYNEQTAMYLTMNELYKKPRNLVLFSAFNWKNTPEGINYWYEINEQINQKFL